MAFSEEFAFGKDTEARPPPHGAFRDVFVSTSASAQGHVSVSARVQRCLRQK